MALLRSKYDQEICAFKTEIVQIKQGWKYRLVIDTTFLAFLLLIITDALLSIFFYQSSPFRCFLLTVYQLVESLNFTFVLVESA